MDTYLNQKFIYTKTNFIEFIQTFDWVKLKKKLCNKNCLYNTKKTKTFYYIRIDYITNKFIYIIFQFCVYISNLNHINQKTKKNRTKCL